MGSGLAAMTLLAIVAIGIPGRAPEQPTRRAPRPGDPFVRVRGNQLVRDGQPFRFVGANLAIMHGPDNRAAAADVLAAAARDGIQVGRIWALGEGEADAAPWLRDNFLFRAGPDGWIDAAVIHLDQVIATAGKLGIRLIITLSNHWSDYGGVPRYLRWAGQWRDDVYGVGDRFYSDPKARTAYRAHVLRLLGRTNHLTGVRYRDDPTILAWELMNESAVATTAGARARRAWIAEMARLIHATDPNHLVTPGVGGYRFERERQDWLAICRLPEVDYCDGHIYPEELLGNRDLSLMDASLDDYVRLAQTIAAKPFVLGEFGVRGDDAGIWRGQPRPFWATRILERLRFDGAAGGLVWIYQRANGADRAHGISVGPHGADPTADALRAAMSTAAAGLTADSGNPPPDGFNPSITVAPDAGGLMPLRAMFAGPSPSVPLVRVDEPAPRALTITWEPTAFARADWEASGIYGGGAIEHAWGGETGWFEYEYEIEPTSPAAPANAKSTSRGKATLTVRARVSSEYPGSLSPPDGASAFEISLDGFRLGRAVAPRDDGNGRWVTVRATTGAGPRNPLTPGRHRLRFTVWPGPCAHGLAIYGRPGDKPVPGAETGPVELRVEAPPR